MSLLSQIRESSSSQATIIDGHLTDRLQLGVNKLRLLFGAYRPLILTVFSLILLTGCYKAITSSGIVISDVNASYLFVLAAVFPIVSVLYGIAGLHISARFIDTSIRFKFWEAFWVNTTAEASHILPLPGAAIVRTAALNSKGAKLNSSAIITTIFAVIWVALATLMAGFFIWTNFDTVIGVSLVVFSSAVIIPTLAWMLPKVGFWHILIFLSHRLSGIGITAFRMFIAFAAIGVFLPLSNTFIYSLAVIAGSSAGIAPAGIGISEVFGSLMAFSLGESLSIAFLAIALDRLVSTISFSTIYLLGLLFKTARAYRPS